MNDREQAAQQDCWKKRRQKERATLLAHVILLTG
jgi:hypothetical protein